MNTIGIGLWIAGGAVAIAGAIRMKAKGEWTSLSHLTLSGILIFAGSGLIILGSLFQ